MQVLKVLSEAGIDAMSCKADLDHLFSDNGEFGHPISGLETEYQQHKYFKSHYYF